MNHKKFGLAAFSNPNDKGYADIGSNVLNKQNDELNNQLQIFQKRLIEFAKKHNAEIKENPEFRSKFIRMCSIIGIDPLQLFDKDKHLFNVEDFYYEICVKIIEICRKTKDVNGGIISFDELLNIYFKDIRKINKEELEKSINMIKSLDGGFEIFEIRGIKFLRSVPNELTSDQTKILEICSILGYSSISLLKANLDWKTIRSRSVLKEMVSNGLLWVDEQAGNETLYWDPSYITRNMDTRNTHI
ncbi:hypothetical protein TBLA_0B04850 [Henningerozyma blattae CBS 6284]|uniref:Vacuolar-sorting protein SNF8 n=1 Tax=Henningerozyma blattae (strain ATCC 34711 / CBS 6284 / DSM 70876 / NBRC 10599 / NRRL Y-10934 / UCD 77-7) TaxID=1071380 RepID=I2GYW7_HENB6|nr:hypothetical protein TBLA_0B04850 [Tetrapisispora blattae CBS 6284]CCH59319.1 hypothetical protein TBLA_0B04850 [Tetrapisispora blattae CBS 6284]